MESSSLKSFAARLSAISRGCGTSITSAYCRYSFYFGFLFGNVSCSRQEKQSPEFLSSVGDAPDNALPLATICQPIWIVSRLKEPSSK